MQTISIGPWRFEWTPGCRLADVHHEAKDHALDCIQVGEYDWQAGKALGTREDFEEACREWLDEYGEDYTNELQYL